MNYTNQIQFQTADEIALQLGDFLKAMRLRQNLTQAEIASKAQISMTAMRNLEMGKGTLHTFIAAMRCIDNLALQSIMDLLSPPPISPMQLLKLQGRSRQRAGTSRKRSKTCQKGKF